MLLGDQGERGKKAEGRGGAGGLGKEAETIRKGREGGKKGSKKSLFKKCHRGIHPSRRRLRLRARWTDGGRAGDRQTKEKNRRRNIRPHFLDNAVQEGETAFFCFLRSGRQASEADGHAGSPSD